MRRRALLHARTLTLTLVVVTTVVAPNASPTSASSTQAGGLYVALGDSIAAGEGARSPSSSYVEQYFGYLQSTRGVTDLANLARPGATSSDLVRSQLPAALEDVNASSDTKAVTIDIGLNDLLSDSNCSVANAPTCPFAANLKTALTDLEAALATDPGAETVQLMQYYNREIGDPDESAARQLLLGTDGTVDCSGTGDQMGLNDLIHCISIQEGAVPVDVLPIFDAAGPAYLADDHLHPNDAGHLAIAKAFGGAATPTTPPPLRCTVPKVTGKPLATAKRLITRAHCSLGRARYRYASAPKGTVLEQRPQPGTKLANLGTVSVTVSRGHEAG
jgi:lysophospholipase L1-like esterase